MKCHDDKLKCKLCKKYMMADVKHPKDFMIRTVHVKCGDWLDEIVHERCWKKFKID